MVVDGGGGGGGDYGNNSLIQVCPHGKRMQTQFVVHVQGSLLSCGLLLDIDIQSCILVSHVVTAVHTSCSEQISKLRGCSTTRLLSALWQASEMAPRRGPFLMPAREQGLRSLTETVRSVATHQ
eukprot:gene560-biopygen9147